ncbi:MAG: hypothetical protein IJU70_09370 [Lentisphaeria bacterium]|nr:hypothetical protein [Lentisphaeria bacterium]
MKNLLWAVFPLLLAAGCTQTTNQEIQMKKKTFVHPLTTLRIYSRDYDSPEKRERICRMLDKCGRIDEVWLSTAAGTQSLAVHRKALEECLKMAEELRKRNIAVSLQLSSTVGHFGGAVFKAKDAYQWTKDDLMVGHDGTTLPGVCCPSSPSFAAWCSDVLAMYCEKLKPLAAYIDDDLRFHELGGIRQGCCCARCLERFSHLTGRKWTREQVQEMLDSPAPRPERVLWTELHTQTIADFCKLAAERVFDVSPETHMGLQTVQAKYFYSCWNFTPVYEALKDPSDRPARVRIGGGSWHDFMPSIIARKSFITSCDIDDAKESKYVDIMGHEEENWPCTVMNKSAHAKALEAAMHLAVGGNNVTFQSGNLWRDSDSTMTELLETIKVWYPLFERLKTLSEKYTFDGITALVQDRIREYPAHGEFPWYAFWAEESEKLRSASLPLRLSKYASRRGGNPGFLTWETARGMTKETFEKFLRSGVVMTGNAYLELQKLGLTKEFGVTASPAAWTNTARFETGPGKSATWYWGMIPSVSFEFGKNCQAEKLLTLVSVERTAVGAWRLETPKGRIAVVGCPGDFTPNLSHYALDFYRDLFDWVGAQPVSVRLEQAAQIVLVPLADENGRLRAVSVLNVGIAPRTGLRLHIRRPFGFRGAWYQAGKEPVRLDSQSGENNSCIFTLPELGAWQFALLELEREAD